MSHARLVDKRFGGADGRMRRALVSKGADAIRRRASSRPSPSPDRGAGSGGCTLRVLNPTTHARSARKSGRFSKIGGTGGGHVCAAETSCRNPRNCHAHLSETACRPFLKLGCQGEIHTIFVMGKRGPRQTPRLLEMAGRQAADPSAPPAEVAGDVGSSLLPRLSALGHSRRHSRSEPVHAAANPPASRPIALKHRRWGYGAAFRTSPTGSP